MQSARQQFADPKIVFTIDIIIPSMKQIKLYLNAGLAYNAYQEIDTLISQLDIPRGETEMLELKELYEEHPFSAQDEKQQIRSFRLIAGFLNRSYYKDYHGYNGIDPDEEFEKEKARNNDSS